MKNLSVWVLTLGVFSAFSASALDGPAANRTAELPVPASFQIRNKQFGDLLRPKDANHATGTPLVLYPAEPWKCMTWKITRADDTAFRLQNHFTSKTFGTRTDSLQSKDLPAVIQIPMENGGPAWAITRLGDGTFKITEPKTGKALTARKDETGSGVRIVLEPFSGADAQKWELKQIDPKSLTM
jgi:hypothetical protein